MKAEALTSAPAPEEAAAPEVLEVPEAEVADPETAAREEVLEDTASGAAPSELHQKLREVFGFGEFRPLQEEAIRATLSGEDVLVVMPTGAGKSLCFQLPAAISEGVTLVVSPLVALMRDQVIGLNDRTSFCDLGCAYINSLQSPEEQRQVLDDIRHGMLKLVYVAPERFRSQGFRSAIKQASIARFVVDEAHCISEWGHDFRPDYLALRPFVEEIGRPPILAVTATATRRVQQSIIDNLGMDDPQVLVGGFDRPNLHFSVVRCASDKERDEKLAKALPKLCSKGGSGLIYASTRKQVEDIAVVAQRALAPIGRMAGAYHAGISVEGRKELQSEWIESRLQVLVATNAFGMGIDKPDVRFVIHYGIPDSLENYYQESGRAGRDGKPARVVVLYRPADRKLREFFIDNEAVDPGTVRSAFVRLKRSADENGEVLVPREWWRHHFPDASETVTRLIWRELEKEGCSRRLGETAEGMKAEILRDEFPPDAVKRIRDDFDRVRGEKLRRLNEMVDYCRTSDCRRTTVLDYFGDVEEAVERRFCCDNCDNPPSEKAPLEEGRAPAPRAPVGAPLNIDGGDVLQILQGMDAMSPKVGKARLNKLLRGANSKDIQKFRDDDNPLLGVLRGCSEKAVDDFLMALIEGGWLYQADEEEYFVVSVSVNGRDAWQSKGAVGVDSPLGQYKRASSVSRSASTSGRSPSTSGAPSSFAGAFENEADAALFEKLRDWRRVEATHANLPAYCVLPDRTLGEIAVARPQSLDELSGIKGLGPMKIEKYGEGLLEVLAG
jgi:ATP-dependent DNA helicase RecQ